jgi:hypothetical protein
MLLGGVHHLAHVGKGVVAQYLFIIAYSAGFVKRLFQEMRLVFVRGDSTSAVLPGPQHHFNLN